MRRPKCTVFRRLRAALAAFALAAPGAVSAWAHGEDEILLFTYLAEEPNMLRLSAGFMGTSLLLLGSYVALAGMRERGRPGEERRRESALKMMGPGALIAAVGMAVLLAAAFILPERLRPPHEHPEPAPRQAAPGGPRSLRGHQPPRPAASLLPEGPGSPPSLPGRGASRIPPPGNGSASKLFGFRS
jgi:hypothetical protein